MKTAMLRMLIVVFPVLLALPALGQGKEKGPVDAETLTKTFEGLKSKEAKVYVGHARNLWVWGTEKRLPDSVVPDLASNLKHSDDRVRHDMAMALSTLGHAANRAEEALRNVLNDDPEATVRGVAAVALATLDPTRISIETKTAVVNALSHRNERVRMYSAQALGSWGAEGRMGLTALRRLAEKDSDRFVRQSAARAVEQILTAR